MTIPNCKENHLDVYDGSSNNGSTLIARFCAENATSEKTVTSTMNALYIVLKSGNNSVQSEENIPTNLGFYAEYKAFQLGMMKQFYFRPYL